MLAFWRPSTVRVSILYTSGMGVLLRRINAAHDSSDAHRMKTSPARATHHRWTRICGCYTHSSFCDIASQTPVADAFLGVYKYGCMETP